MQIAGKDNVWTDELDCSKSFARKPSNKTREEVLEICLKNKSHFVFIFRDQSFLDKDSPFAQNYWDVGCSTLCNNPDYFLWIKLTEEQGCNLAKKHKLKEHA